MPNVCVLQIEQASETDSEFRIKSFWLSKIYFKDWFIYMKGRVREVRVVQKREREWDKRGERMSIFHFQMAKENAAGSAWIQGDHEHILFPTWTTGARAIWFIFCCFPSHISTERHSKRKRSSQKCPLNGMSMSQVVIYTAMPWQWPQLEGFLKSQ